jgi:hypothetical protein
MCTTQISSSVWELIFDGKVTWLIALSNSIYFSYAKFESFALKADILIFFSVKYGNFFKAFNR